MKKPSEKITGFDVFNEKDFGVSIVTLLLHSKIKHQGHKTSVVYLVTKGSVTVKVGGKIIVASKHETIHIRPETPYEIMVEKTKSVVKLFKFGYKCDRRDDTHAILKQELQPQPQSKLICKHKCKCKRKLE